MSFWKNLFGLDRVVPQADDVSAHLITVYSNAEQAALEALLRGNDVPYRICERGEGGVIRVFTGCNNMYGSDVFVRPDDLERAKALIDSPADESDKSDEQESSEQS